MWDLRVAFLNRLVLESDITLFNSKYVFFDMHCCCHHVSSLHCVVPEANQIFFAFLASPKLCQL